MRHHKHPGLAGCFDAARGELLPHSDAADEARRVQVWIPLPDNAGREIDGLEGLACVPTRPGAVRVVAVPHVATDLAFGDELAVDEWDGDWIARGPLASSLSGTVRIVGADDGAHDWRTIAGEIDAVVARATPTQHAVHDVISETAVAVSVPRLAMRAVFAHLHAADPASLRWEYATSMRHSN